MGVRTIVLLLAAAGGLLAVLLLTDEKQKARNAAEVAVLDGRTLVESRRVWWQFADRPAIELSRAVDGRFSITEPLVDVVSPGYLKVIFDAWDSAQMRATPLADDADGRGKAGLSPPELTFRAEFADGARVEVEVGAPGPLGTTRFLRSQGRIWEGGDGLIECLRVGIDDLRDHAVFRHAPPLATELRVEQVLPTGKREALHLKRDAGDWRLLSPVTGRADGAAAQRFLTAVLALRVDAFVPGLARLPTEDPAIVIVVRGAHGEETIRLWERDGQVFGQLPDRNVTFNSDNRQYCAIFQNAAEQLRARILVPLGSVYEDLADLVVDPGQGRGDRLRLVRAGTVDEWRLVEPLPFAGRATACNEAAQAINNLHAMEFVEDEGGVRPGAGDPRFGLGPGRLQVSARGREQQQPIELWFGNEVAKNGIALVYACRADEQDNVVLVPKEPVDHLRRAWTDYCSLVVVRQPAAVERLDLARRTGERRTFRQEGEHWRLEGKDGHRDDVGGFANDILRDLDGKRAVDLRGDALGPADWTLALARANGDRLAMLRIWERADGAPLVVQSGEAAVGFELGDFVDKQLRELWQ